MKPVTEAMILAPIAPAAFWGILTLNPAAFLIGCIVSYAVLFTVGIPLYLITKKFFVVNFYTCGIGGVLTVCLFFLALSIFSGNGISLDSASLNGLFMFQIFGFIAGVTFWFLGVKSKPNK